MVFERAMRAKKFGEVGHGARLTVTATDAHRFFEQKSRLYGMSACEGLSAKYNCAPTPAADIIGWHKSTPQRFPANDKQT
jgi:hypothetical protein